MPAARHDDVGCARWIGRLPHRSATHHRASGDRSWPGNIRQGVGKSAALTCSSAVIEFESDLQLLYPLAFRVVRPKVWRVGMFSKLMQVAVLVAGGLALGGCPLGGARTAAPAKKPAAPDYQQAAAPVAGNGNKGARFNATHPFLMRVRLLPQGVTVATPPMYT